MSDSKNHFFIQVTAGYAGQRLDRALAEMLPEYTRAAIQSWIKSDLVICPGKTLKPKTKLVGDENLEITIPVVQAVESTAENIPLDRVYEDEHILVINKPAGLVVHPGAGNTTGTLMNGLLFHYPESTELPRAGIVHRLDKDTSGLMVVAKTELARQNLIAQLDQRTVKREYLALAEGQIISGRSIDAPIGRHRVDRTKMAVIQSGKEAVTHIRVIEKFAAHTLLLASLETGRTHQIRVHLSYIGHPLLGDHNYGSRNRLPAGAGNELISTISGFARQALHATSLAIIHPSTGETMSWHRQAPDDLSQLLTLLEKHRDQINH